MGMHNKLHQIQKTITTNSSQLVEFQFSIELEKFLEMANYHVSFANFKLNFAWYRN